MTTGFSYAAGGGSGSKSLKWSAFGLAGRQGVGLLFSVILARILGPDAYGLIAQATIYIALMTLLLDQGVSAALTSVGELSNKTAGAASTLNVILALILSAITFMVAPQVSDFFREPDLTAVLYVLASALILKSLAIVPRMLLSRQLDFRSISLADFAGAATGGVVGLSIALVANSYWALVIQTVTMDFVTVCVLMVFARPPRPNGSLKLVVSHLRFSGRVFGSNFLSYAASNAGNILIGRAFSSSALGFYNFAYGLTQMPVAITGQMINRVLFPVVARRTYRNQPINTLVVRALRGISFLTFPLMALIGVTAPEVVPVILGDEWSPAIPVMVVFAISGARQSLTTLNTPVLLGLGKASVQLRFSLVAATLQVIAILVGLRWGIIGVAIGFTAAGFLLTPVISMIQRHFANVSYRDQWAAIFPALHGSFWLVAAYLAVGAVAPDLHIVKALAGSAAGTLFYALVLRYLHPKYCIEVIGEIKSGFRK